MLHDDADREAYPACRTSFTGGTIHRAVVDVSGAPFVDLAAEARMAFMRD